MVDQISAERRSAVMAKIKGENRPRASRKKSRPFYGVAVSAVGQARLILIYLFLIESDPILLF